VPDTLFKYNFASMTDRRGRRMRLRNTLWRQLAPEAYDGDGLSPTNMLVVWVVVLSSLLALLETEPTIEGIAPQTFAYIERTLAVLFLIEYGARLWVEGENPRFGGIGGRIRYAFTPAAIIDSSFVFALSRCAGDLESYVTAHFPVDTNTSSRQTGEVFSGDAPSNGRGCRAARRVASEPYAREHNPDILGRRHVLA
jgi:hypothetical protein